MVGIFGLFERPCTPLPLLFAEGEEAKKEKEKEKKREKCKAEGCHKLLGFFWEFHHFVGNWQKKFGRFKNTKNFNIFGNSTKRRKSFGSPYYHHHDDEQRHHQQQQQQNKIKDEQLLFLFPEQLIGQRKPIYNNDWSEKLKTEEMPSSSNFWKIQHCALHFRNKYL